MNERLLLIVFLIVNNNHNNTVPEHFPTVDHNPKQLKHVAERGIARDELFQCFGSSVSTAHRNL